MSRSADKTQARGRADDAFLSPAHMPTFAECLTFLVIAFPLCWALLIGFSVLGD